MNEPYCKLACSILDSSIWDEDDDTRIVWITLMAMKGPDGMVRAAITGIANRARKAIDATQKAVDKLCSPDPLSKNQDNEGRRVKRVPGGWLVLNHEFYRNMFSEEEHREYERERKADYRARKSGTVRDCPGQNRNVPDVPQSDQIRSDQKDNGPHGAAPAPTKTDSEWFEELKTKPCYTGIDLSREWGLMEAWCEVHHKKTTRRRFVNWLARVDKQIELKPAGTPNADLMGLPKQIFPQAGNTMIAVCMEEIKSIRKDMVNWEFALAKATRDSIAWLTENKTVGWEAKVEAMKTNRKNYVPSQLKGVAQTRVRQLNERIAEIKRRMR